MNRIITCLLMLALFSSVAYNQEERSQFQFGIKAGGNLSNVYDVQDENFVADAKFGFAGGVFFTIPIVKLIGFQPEVLFSQKGFKSQGNLLGGEYNLTRTTNFLDVPLYVTVKPLNSLTLMAGPQFSYLLKRKDVFENNDVSIEIIEEFENDNIRKNIFGVAAGLDVNLSKVVLGARTGWDLMTNNGDGTSQTPRYKNAWVQATVGIRLL
jgi:hypothetical protein